MKSKITLNNSIFSSKINQRLITASRKYWEEHINVVLKRKFLHLIYIHDREIRKCRQRLGIPPDGFNSKEAIRKWLTQKRKRAWPKVIKHRPIEETTSYKHYGFVLYDPKVKTNLAKYKNITKNTTSFNRHFKELITSLANKIQLDRNWYMQFEEYILTGNIEMVSVMDNGTKLYKKTYRYSKEKPFEGKIVLEMGPNITLDDLELVWQYQLKHLIESLPGHIDIPPNYKPVKPVNKKVVKRIYQK